MYLTEFEHKKNKLSRKYSLKEDIEEDMGTGK
jgi:hypothetical protein